jgi:hypothetical protein
MTAVETRTLSILIFIVSLLGEHYDFDHLRVERPGEDNNDPLYEERSDLSQNLRRS